MRLGVAGERQFAGGIALPLERTTLQPTVLVGSGVATASLPAVRSRRHLLQLGLALHAGADPAWLEISWLRTHARTDTWVRLPGFALTLHEPALTLDQLQLTAGGTLGGGATLRGQWRIDLLPRRAAAHRAAVALSIPLPPDAGTRLTVLGRRKLSGSAK